jgi:hypothetical protein
MNSQNETKENEHKIAGSCSCDGCLAYAAYYKELNAKSDVRKAKLAATKALKPRVKPIKHELICYVLYKNEQMMNRVEILKTVHALENSPLPFKPTSNHDYFKNVTEATLWPAIWGSNPANQSVIFKGLVTIVWAPKGRKVLGYKLTEAGIELAKKTEELFFSGVLSQET